MFKAIRDYLHEITADQDRAFAPDDHRLAVAALLVHLISVDGTVKDSERVAIRSVLAQQYGLAEDETDRLVEQAKRADDEAVDLYGFTSVLKRALDDEGRRHVVEMMWEAVYADGVATEFEENTVWRVAELLGVSTRDRVTLRKQVAHRHESDDHGGADGEGH